MTILKTDRNNVPLDRVPSLARALEVDRAYLMQLALDQGRMTGHDHDDGMFTLPTAPSGSWNQLTANEQAWIEFIRVISCGGDPKVMPARIRSLRELFDAGRG